MPGITGNRAAMVQGCLAHKKQRPPRTPQKDYTYDPSVVLGGGGAASYERGTPVEPFLLVHVAKGTSQCR